MPFGLRNAARVASRYMKRNIQIEFGLYHQDPGNYGSHLDEPCPIHENSKHTARQCHVLKKLRRPLTAAHRPRLNQESSPDRLAFLVAHTTISPNYPREELETLDRQILVVSADVPQQDGETDVQRQERENANAARAVQRQQKIATAAPGVGLQPANAEQVNAGQVNTNAGQVNPSARQANPNAAQQALVSPLPHSSDAKMIHLVPTDCMHEIF
jgi:hypothetical protein